MNYSILDRVVSQTEKGKVPCPGLSGEGCGFLISTDAFEQWGLCAKCNAARLIHSAEGLAEKVSPMAYEEALRILCESRDAFEQSDFRTALSKIHAFFPTFTRTRAGLALAHVSERDLVLAARKIFRQASAVWETDPYEALRLIEQMWDIQDREMQIRERPVAPPTTPSKKGPPPEKIARKQEKSERDRRIRAEMRGGGGGSQASRDKRSRR